MDFTGIFSSDRLIYEPFDNNDPETNTFMYNSLLRDNNVAGMTFGHTIRPLTKTNLTGFYDCVKKDVIAAIVCLKPDNWAEISRLPTDKTFRGTPIGYIALHPISRHCMQNRSGDLSISLASAYHGKGYGTEALNWLADWAFNYGNLHSLRLTTSSKNMSGIHAYKKVGFVEEGRLRESSWINGEWTDTLCMSLLEWEWRAIRGKATNSQGKEE